MIQSLNILNKIIFSRLLLQNTKHTCVVYNILKKYNGNDYKNILFDDSHKIITNYKKNIYYYKYSFENNNFCPKYNLDIIKFPPYSYTNFHYHNNKGCLFTLLEGNLMEIVEIEADKSCEQKAYKQLQKYYPSYINDFIGRHKIVNNTDKPAYSLQLYSNKLI